MIQAIFFFLYISYDKNSDDDIDKMNQQHDFSHFPKLFTLNEQTSLADASVLLAITQEPDAKILFTKRASHLNKHAGEISFPGGKREEHDADNIMVALRESEEETGLSPQVVQILGDLPRQTSKYGLTVQPIIGMIPANYNFQVQESEIERIFLLEIQALLEAEIMPYRVQYAGKYYRVPSFQLENEIIWGLTGRILVDFMQQAFNYQKEWKMLL